MRPAKRRLTRRHELTLEALEYLVHTAERCLAKRGYDDDGIPEDGNDWIDLRRALTEARHALAREGVKCPALYGKASRPLDVIAEVLRRYERGL